MVPKITPKFSEADIKAYILKRKAGMENAIFMALQKVGENYVTNARNRGEYTDRSDNLRSSVGYGIYKDGVLVWTITGDAKKATKEGTEAAQRLIAKIKGELLAKYDKGFVLVVVAGMSYAAAVEAKGFDVITGSGLIAITELKKSLKRIEKKLSKM